MNNITIAESVTDYINFIQASKSKNTFRLYKMAVVDFITILHKHGIDPEILNVSFISIEWIKIYILELKGLSPSTIRTSFVAVKGYYDYVANACGVSIDFSKISELARNFLPKQETVNSRKPDFQDVSRVVNYVLSQKVVGYNDLKEKLRILRDKAVILLLADTGISVEYACNLTYASVDWKRRILKTEKKGQHELHISRRAFQALQDYLQARTSDKKGQVPLFARHDKGVGKNISPVTTATIRNIVDEWANRALGDQITQVDITPISLRYYYEANLSQSVLVLLHPKIAEKCEFLYQNANYEEAIFNAMKVIEEEIRERTCSDPTDVGAKLISKTMGLDSVKLRFSQVKDEQESAFFLFRGALGVFKNPSSHKFVNHNDHVKTLECLSFASLLMRLLDEIQ